MKMTWNGFFQFGYEALIRGHSGAPAAAAGI